MKLLIIILLNLYIPISAIRHIIAQDNSIQTTNVGDGPGLFYANKDCEIIEIIPSRARYAFPQPGKNNVIGNIGTIIGNFPLVFIQFLMDVKSNDSFYIINGEHSKTRLHDKKPVFYTKCNPCSFTLIRLIYHPNKKIRFAIDRSGTWIIREDVMFSFKKEMDGSFQLFPLEELTPGEYAFKCWGNYFYDFGIE